MRLNNKNNLVLKFSFSNLYIFELIRFFFQNNLFSYFFSFFNIFFSKKTFFIKKLIKINQTISLNDVRKNINKNNIY